MLPSMENDSGDEAYHSLSKRQISLTPRQGVRYSDLRPVACILSLHRL
jgi:hypothetical protein